MILHIICDDTAARVGVVVGLLSIHTINLEFTHIRLVCSDILGNRKYY